MTIATKLAALAFVSAATAAGATNGGQNFNDAENKLPHPPSGQVTGNPGSVNVTGNRPIEKVVDLGDCDGPVYQGMFAQIVTYGQAEIQTSSFLGMTSGRTTYTHNPNVTRISATSFSLHIPGGSALNEAERIQVSEDLTESILIKNFRAKQYAAGINVNNTTAVQSSPSAVVTGGAVRTEVNINAVEDKSGAANVTYVNTAANSVYIPNYRPEMILTFTCTPAPTNDMK